MATTREGEQSGTERGRSRVISRPPSFPDEAPRPTGQRRLCALHEGPAKTRLQLHRLLPDESGRFGGVYVAAG